jgi:uncharacterized protein YueI
MLDEEHLDFVVAFHPDVEKSKGTKDMIKRAKKNRISYQIVSDQEGKSFIEIFYPMEPDGVLY